MLLIGMSRVETIAIMSLGHEYVGVWALIDTAVRENVVRKQIRDVAGL